jgi:hypothetical protein
MEGVMAEWAVFWGGLVIFGLIPGAFIGWAYYVGRDIKASDEMEHIGSQDVDNYLKRYKDQ